VAGEVLLSLRNPEKDLRGWLLGGLRSLAKDYLTQRTLELAVAHGCVIENVRIKELSSKWGSCSSKRNINLNWRLIFMPRSASDYIILHEFAHLKEMNHGPRFWKEVQRLCPGYEKEERMIKEYQWVLGLM
jgi:predicted metal-dependent hydrolase